MELTFLLLSVGYMSVFWDIVDQSVGKDLPPALDILSHVLAPKVGMLQY